jgi:hypothetical protein
VTVETWPISRLIPYDRNALAVTRPGDLWLMGEHRLLCGDATSAEDVGLLFSERKAEILFTSPPYLICYGLEIDPRYCDVIVQRWQNFTGKQATLENAHGATFEHVKEGRRLAKICRHLGLCGADDIREEILS